PQPKFDLSVFVTSWPAHRNASVALLATIGPTLEGGLPWFARTIVRRGQASTISLAPGSQSSVLIQISASASSTCSPEGSNSPPWMSRCPLGTGESGNSPSTPLACQNAH